MTGTGGRRLREYTPDLMRDLFEAAQDSTKRAQHDSEINRVLADLLGQYNRRDVELTRTRLDEIERELEDSLETTLDMRFGGSVAKHTYVDGLSDVDTLAILRHYDQSSSTQGRFSRRLRKSWTGTYAITSRYTRGGWR